MDSIHTLRPPLAPVDGIPHAHVRVSFGILGHGADRLRLESGAAAPFNPIVIALNDLADAADNLVPNLKVPHQVFDVRVELRGQLEEAGIQPSDRRWTQAMSLPRASAFIE